MAHGCVVSEYHTRADIGGQTPGSWGKCLVDLVVVIASDIEPTEKFKQKWEFLGKVKERDNPRNCNYFQVLPYAHLFGCVYICVSVCLNFNVFLFLFFIYILFSTLNRTLLQCVSVCVLGGWIWMQKVSMQQRTSVLLHPISVQSLSVSNSVTPWTEALQASLSITNSNSCPYSW